MIQKKNRKISAFSLIGVFILLSLISIQLSELSFYNFHDDRDELYGELGTNPITTYEINTFSIKIDNVDPNEDINYHTWDWWKDTYTWCDKIGDVYYIQNVELSGGHYIAIVDSSVNFVIENCKVYESNQDGIILQNVNNGKLLNNNFSYNTNNGIQLEKDCYNNEIIGNKISKNDQNGILLEEIQTSDWHIIHGTTYYYHPCNNNDIINNTLNSNSLSGIKVVGINSENTNKYNSIEGNIAINNEYHGIHIIYGEQHTIEKNSLNNNGMDGLSLKNSDKNSIFNNKAEGNGESGIFLKYCKTGSNWNNELSSNTVSNNEYGIYLESSDRNYIGTANVAKGNSRFGIYLSEKSRNNMVTGNIVADNAEYEICYEDDQCSGNIFEDNDVTPVNLANPPNQNGGGFGPEYLMAIVFIGFFIGLIGSVGYVNKTKRKRLRNEEFVERNMYNQSSSIIHNHRTQTSLSGFSQIAPQKKSITPKEIAPYEFYCSKCDKKSIGYQVFCPTCGERMSQPELAPKSDSPEKYSCVICHSSTCSSCSHNMNGEHSCYEECPYCGRSYHRHCWDETIKEFGKCGFCLETPPPELMPESFEMKTDREIRYSLDY